MTTVEYRTFIIIFIMIKVRREQKKKVNASFLLKLNRLIRFVSFCIAVIYILYYTKNQFIFRQIGKIFQLKIHCI